MRKLIQEFDLAASGRTPDALRREENVVAVAFLIPTTEILQICAIKLVGLWSFRLGMDSSMTTSAQGYEVLLDVTSGSTAKANVMYFEMGHAAASLASPPIAPKYLFTQFFVSLRSQPHSRIILSDPVHDIL